MRGGQLSSLLPGDSGILGQYSFAGGTESSECLCLWVTLQPQLPGPAGPLTVFLAAAGPAACVGGLSHKACAAVQQFHVIFHSCAGSASGSTSDGVAGWTCPWPRMGETPGSPAEPGWAGSWVASTTVWHPPLLVGITCPSTAGQAFTNLCKTTTFYFHFIFPWPVSAMTPCSGCPQC